ncbi:DUF5723 family protein [Pedobacter foliorum]|uniref:DUF5723 family protein n=1 Tax=Pedobacter foliorum TaxID=2739058 RepID=UPI0015635E03|nr:DUF5723 family protein [Pedobacter foliorum]NRF41277.1 hypothetical protein [Pedobacter foliorum]
MRKPLILFFLLLLFNQLKAQQYGLFNTKTLFDGFENPAQKTFVLDSSRKYASNFFLPYLGINATTKGGDDVIRRLISTGDFSATGVSANPKDINRIYQNSNLYLFNFKIFKSYKFQKELGFSWQLRTDANLKYSNGLLIIFDQKEWSKIKEQSNDALNNDGYSQSYHQFSVTYRENYNKKLAFGAKLSLLSGITYNELKVNNSTLDFTSDGVTPEGGDINMNLSGSYKSNFLRAKDQSGSILIPNFKNPGLAVSFGTTYISKTGYTLIANIKDLGFIRWANKSYVANFNNTVLNIPRGSTTKEAENKITDVVIKNAYNKSFISPTNAKADFLISKTFNFYTPSFIVSKNLFYNGGDVALVNKFGYSGFSVSAIPAYNFNNLFLFGMQGMYQTPNFEFFMGSDNLFKTARTAYAAIQSTTSSSSGYNGASFYIGLGIKFGYTVEHPQNSSYMPGLDDLETSFFKRVFSIFSKNR